jgi:DNA-binding transcriptional regulator YiaG
MNGSKLIGTLKRQMGVVTDKALASRLGLTTQSIQNWKNRKTITSRQLVGLLSPVKVMFTC